MAARVRLLRVECPGRLTVEIVGPQRTQRFALPTGSRLFLAGYPLEQIKLQTFEGALEYKPGPEMKCPVFLFEETDYEFIVTLDDKELTPANIKLSAPGRRLPDELRQVANSNVLTCVLNVGSQAGYLDLDLAHDGQFLLKLGLEVFPSKIDYRKDLVDIRVDLEREVRELAHDIGRLTYHKASRRRGVQPGEVEWLENIRSLFDDLQKAFNRIRQAPRTKIDVDEQIRRADRPTRHGASVLRFVRSHAGQCVESAVGHFQVNEKTYRARVLPVERKILSYDTVENRFVKWAVALLLRRVRLSCKRLSKPEGTTSDPWVSRLQRADRELRRDLDAGFLQEVNGSMSAPVQSLALHMAPGYREFFTTFLDILSGLEIHGGPFDLSEKELSTLYEMWCFIKLGSLLRRDCRMASTPNWLKVDRSGITVKLKKGVTSKLSLQSKQGEKIRLSYNPSESSPTGNWRPDNMLEIRKGGNKRGFHYVFDAKYRLADDADYVAVHKAPGPPEDTINRMHAYRDQIVYDIMNADHDAGEERTVWDVGQRLYAQKTVSAFVLYPYSGADAEKNQFYGSINKVGIGGLPFLPGNTDLVNNLLKQILDRTDETEEDIAVQLRSVEERRKIMRSLQYGMLAIVPTKEQLDYILKHQIYHMPYAELQGVRLRADFIVFFQSKKAFGKESGIHYWAPVKNFRVGMRNQIKPAPPGPGRHGGLYAWFELRKAQTLERPIPANPSGHPQFFRVTTRLALDEARTMEELSLVREPERRLYRELLAAGYKVAIKEVRAGKPTYDIADLNLSFEIYGQKKRMIRIRFDSRRSAFISEGQESFRFDDLMFDPAACLGRLRLSIGQNPTKTA
ncbi:MAG: DUF2357 domain-containing protein [Verrucomicrobia bacterium]|nr:DUF2357 domain-containing protein [Verrucomicrobiota bacterium]